MEPFLDPQTLQLELHCFLVTWAQVLVHLREEIRVWKKKDKTDLRLIIFLVVNGGPAVGLNDGGEAGEAAGGWGRGTGGASE